MLSSRRISTRAAAALVAAAALAAAVVPATAASAATPPKPLKTTGGARTPVHNVGRVDSCALGSRPISSLPKGMADEALHCLINQARAANGVPPLVKMPATLFMSKSARAHALLSVNQRFWTTGRAATWSPAQQVITTNRSPVASWPPATAVPAAPRRARSPSPSPTVLLPRAL